MQKITPFLWFDDKAEEAAEFYVSVFKKVFGKSKAKMGQVSHYDADSAKASGRPEGSAMVVAFELYGMKFNAINGGPVFTMNPAISFAVDCKTQKEVDALWEMFTADGGAEGQCGWLTDKYNMSWQILPSDLMKYVGGKNEEGANRAMKAMLRMNKLDIGMLKAAYKGEE